MEKIGFDTQEERDEYLKSLIAQKKRISIGGNRSWSDEDVLIRRESIYYWMGQGKSSVALKSFLANLWQAPYTTVENYIKDAKKALVKQSEENIDEYRRNMIEKLERIADDAMKAGHNKVALAAYDQINKLQSAYTQKVEADLKTDIKFKFGE